MESSEKFLKTIELGRKIAQDLAITSRTDFLGGWMAHYVAELIKRYENASAEEKEDAGDRAFEAILKLWNHRYRSPCGFDAIKRSEAILETLSRLHPEEARPFYYRSPSGEDLQVGEDFKELSEIALGIDRTARRLLRALLLVMTIKATGEETAEYIRLAMPDNLTDDLFAVSELVSEVSSEDFPEQFQILLQQVHDFGSICMNFGKEENSEHGPT